MFGTSTNETLPEIYLTSYEAWDGYMAEIWSSILKWLDIPKDACIVEVGPGTSAKLALALAKMDFSGIFYLVEPCAGLLEKITGRCREFLPRARIHAVEATLLHSLPQLPHAPHLLASNHCLDDMILAHGLAHEDFGALFTWAASPSARLMDASRERWCGMRQQSGMVERATANAVQEWRQACAKLKPAAIALSQYSSSALINDAVMNDLNIAAKAALWKLKTGFTEYKNIQALLNKHKNFNNHYIGTEVLDAGNWLVMEA